MGKHKLVAETGAGQHGVAKCHSGCIDMGIDCFMGRRHQKATT